MLLVMLGCGMILRIFTYGAGSADIFHMLLVLAFAIPGASWGYDIQPNSRGMVLGWCISATVGAVLLSLFVLAGGFR